NVRRLYLPLLLLVVVLDAGDASAFRGRQDPSDGAPRSYLRARLLRVSQVGDKWIGERTDRAADVAPAVIDAGRPPLVFRRVHPDRCWNHTDADRLEPLEPDLTITKSLHRRHRVGLTGRPPDFFRFGIARDTYGASVLAVEGRDALIRERPVRRAVMLAFDLEIPRQ